MADDYDWIKTQLIDMRLIYDMTDGFDWLMTKLIDMRLFMTWLMTMID